VKAYIQIGLSLAMKPLVDPLVRSGQTLIKSRSSNQGLHAFDETWFGRTTFSPIEGADSIRPPIPIRSACATFGISRVMGGLRW
jgi:hypothetical protein